MSGDGTKVVVGTLAGIMEKSGDWREIHIAVPGKQYPVKLSTKIPELVELARAAGENVMEWTYSEQDSGTPNPHQPGKNFINRYFSGVAPVGSTPESSTGSVATPAAAAKDVMTKDDWAAKDSAIHHMAAIKAAADALKHTIPSEPSRDDLNNFASNVLHVARSWHRIVLATRDDPNDEEVPF